MSGDGPVSAQHLRVLPDVFTVDLRGEAPSSLSDLTLAVVHGPDGWTTVTRVQDPAAADAEGTQDGWIALWSGDRAHDPSATGMIAALTGPLAAARVPVLALATYSADLVLVPLHLGVAAVTALRRAGHHVDDEHLHASDPAWSTRLVDPARSTRCSG